MPSLSSKLRPDKPLSQALQLKAPLSMILPAPPRSAEATRQASIVAYLNDFALMMILALGSCIVLVRQPPRPAIKPAIRVGGASIRPSGLAWGESSFILITQRGYRPAFNADWWLISSLRFACTRLAKVSLASSRFARLKSAFVRFAKVRLARSRFAAERSVELRLASLRSAPFRSASRRDASLRSAFLSSLARGRVRGQGAGK
jgi:hypothetical protein